MARTVSAVIIAVILLLALGLMVWSWRRRRARQAGFDVLASVPGDLGRVLASGSGLYLATTPAGDRLERIAVAGLGFRARLEMVVAERGILLPFPEGDVFIPAGDVVGVSRASWTIDRGIEPAGITVVGWMLGGRAVESFVRLDEPRTVEAAARTLLPAPAANGSDPQ